MLALLLDLKYILPYYFITLLFSIFGWTLLAKTQIFKNMADKGYGLSRALGILVFSFTSWSIASFFKFSFTTEILWALLLVSTCVLAVTQKNQLLVYLKENKGILIFVEILFIVSYSLMLLYRGAYPNIQNIEKFMDFGIINGLYRGKSLPPEDVWFSGNSINYYYFGHYYLAIINKLSNIPTAISYNLNVALIFALTVTGAFSINLTLTRNKFFSVFGSLILVLAGNLDYLRNSIFYPNSIYHYAQARNLVPFTINEFPAYSFIISDLHAHILDLPFVLLFIGLLIQLFFNKELIKNELALGLLTLCLGALGVINSWDLLVYFPLLIQVVLFITLSPKKLLKAGIVSGLMGVGSLLLFLPFYLNFKAGVNGVGLPTELIHIKHLVTMFGFFIFAFITFLVTQKHNLEDKIILLFFVYGFLLALLPNVVFLKDIYFQLNPQYYRANTVFKFWYQAWVLLSLTCSYVYYSLYTKLKNKLSFRGVGLSLVLVVLSFYIFKYSYVGYKHVIKGKYSYVGLDGSSYLLTERTGDKLVIDWININIKDQPVLLEVWGKPYTADSLVSSYTGLPTIVGWNEHELGWRNNWPEIAFRMGDIEKMYTSNSTEEIQNLLKKYQVKYALISTSERERYGESVGSTLRLLGNTVFSYNETELIEIK